MVHLLIYSYFSELDAFHRASKLTSQPVCATYFVSGDISSVTRALKDGEEMDVDSQGEETSEEVPVRKVVLVQEEGLEGE